MNAQQAENLRILIRHMETKCNRMLNMTTVGDCGTPACALGEAAFVVDGLREHFVRSRSTYEMAAELFGLPYNPGGDAPIYRIFGAQLNGERFVSPQKWAIEARKVLAENGYTMDGDGFDRFMAKVREPVTLESAAIFLYSPR
jgi:hypothetical protein